MTELERSIAAYATFLDEQSLARSSDHIIQSDPDEGEVIMVDIKIRETGTDRPDDEARRRKWLPYTILAAAAAIVILVAVTLFDGTEDTSEVDVVDNPDDVDAPATPEQAVFGAESSLALADTYLLRGVQLGRHRLSVGPVHRGRHVLGQLQRAHG